MTDVMGCFVGQSVHKEAAIHKGGGRGARDQRRWTAAEALFVLVATVMASAASQLDAGQAASEPVHAVVHTPPALSLPVVIGWSR